jgi:hypothetical protein
MNKKNNFSDFMNHVEPLRRNASGEMIGGFTSFGGQNNQTVVLQPFIMNSILVGVLGYSCSCTCQCGC